VLIEHPEPGRLDTEAARQQAVAALNAVGKFPAKATQEQRFAILRAQVERAIPTLAQLVEDLANEVDAARAELDLERREGEEAAAFQLETSQRLAEERNAALEAGRLALAHAREALSSFEYLGSQASPNGMESLRGAIGTLERLVDVREGEPHA
jgi:hypothetical protein